MLARQAHRQVQGEVHMLRYRSTSHAELAALGIPPRVIEEAVQLHAEERQRLEQLEREVSSVRAALRHESLQGSSEP